MKPLLLAFLALLTLAGCKERYTWRQKMTVTVAAPGTLRVIARRKRAVLMRAILGLFCISSLMTSQAWGDGHEASIADVSRMCSQVLNTPPFTDFRNWTENGRYSQIASDHQGAALVGIACNEETLTRFMELAGWEKTVARRNLKEEAFGIQYDEDVHFCLRRSLLGQLIMGKCKGLVVFRLKGGKIRHITAGAII